MTKRGIENVARNEGGEKLLSQRNVTAILECRLQNCEPRLNIRCHVNEILSTARRFDHDAKITRILSSERQIIES